MFTFLILEVVSAVVGVIALGIFVVHLVRHRSVQSVVRERGIYIPALLLLVALVSGFMFNKTYSPDFAMPTFMHSHAPGGVPPSIPFSKIINFFARERTLEHVSDIGADPNAVPKTPQEPDADGIIRISLTTKEVISEIAPGIFFNYWTFDKQVPGPMLRIREGDTVEVTITNDPSSLHDHNIDLHAVTGPGGGSVYSHVSPGETKSFRWKALQPGLFVYHCAMPNVSTHNSHGQYGLILVEPKGGLPPVDKEFYLMQGELYTLGDLGKKGLVAFDSEALLDGIPNYVTFNGRVEDTPRMYAHTGDKVRIYVGNGGVNLISSFHIIGEIFDTVYPNASIGGALEHNTQTALVSPGGASIVDVTVNVPGKYLIVDHALARMNKGAWAVLEVSGPEDKSIFAPVNQGEAKGE
jgi:nitrite reductase (NO-forming)